MSVAVVRRSVLNEFQTAATGTVLRANTCDSDAFQTQPRSQETHPLGSLLSFLWPALPSLCGTNLGVVWFLVGASARGPAALRRCRFAPLWCKLLGATTLFPCRHAQPLLVFFLLGPRGGFGSRPSSVSALVWHLGCKHFVRRLWEPGVVMDPCLGLSGSSWGFRPEARQRFGAGSLHFCGANSLCGGSGAQTSCIPISLCLYLASAFYFISGFSTATRSAGLAPAMSPSGDVLLARTALVAVEGTSVSGLPLPPGFPLVGFHGHTGVLCGRLSAATCVQV